MGFYVDDIEAVVAGLCPRGVVFEQYDGAVNGIMDIEGNYPDLAAELMRQLQSAAHRTERVVLRTVSACCEALLAPAPELDSTFRAALTACDASTLPLEHARTLPCDAGAAADLHGAVRPGLLAGRKSNRNAGRAAEVRAGRPSPGRPLRRLRFRSALGHSQFASVAMRMASSRLCASSLCMIVDR